MFERYLSPQGFRIAAELRVCHVCRVCAVLACLGGCAGQGEGELCNRLAGNNGNDDCQSGLVCNTAVTSTPGFGRCCPMDMTHATTAVCKGSTGGIDASPAPPDAGGADSADAATE
jgi:hypothetical protein